MNIYKYIRVHAGLYGCAQFTLMYGFAKSEHVCIYKLSKTPDLYFLYLLLCFASWGGGEKQPNETQQKAHSLFPLCVSVLTWGTCSISRRKICWLRDTEFKRWYSTKSLRELNFTTHRKYFPAPSRRTLKCWTSFPNLENVTWRLVSNIWG